MAIPYKPVSCSFYDQLEAFATLGTPCEVVFSTAAGRVTLQGRIRDLYTREKIEYLRLDSSPEIRLDTIERINGVATTYQC